MELALFGLAMFGGLALAALMCDLVERWLREPEIWDRWQHLDRK